MLNHLKNELKEINLIGNRIAPKQKINWRTILISAVLQLAIVLSVFYNQDALFYQPYIRESLNQSITIKVADECNYGDNFDKVHCVNRFVKNNFKYVLSPTKSVNETIEGGGDCKSWTVAYRSILQRMDIKTKAINTEGHIFAIANWKGGYCILDETEVNCAELS